jgi:hypothetical protein
MTRTSGLAINNFQDIVGDSQQDQRLSKRAAAVFIFSQRACYEFPQHSANNFLLVLTVVPILLKAIESEVCCSLRRALVHTAKKKEWPGQFSEGIECNSTAKDRAR